MIQDTMFGWEMQEEIAIHKNIFLLIGRQIRKVSIISGKNGNILIKEQTMMLLI